MTAVTAARQSLLAYSRARWSGFRIGPHHGLIAAALSAVEAGLLQRLVISCPPRHGKSELVSRDFPAWFLGRNPTKQVIFGTYSDDFAADFGREVRNRLTEPIHQDLFPECGLRADSKAASRFHTGAGGVYHAVGVGGGMTGKGAHLLIIDDPVKARTDAESPTSRKALFDWYNAVARTRLMPQGAIVLVMTRWHEEDLAGAVLKHHAHEGWTELRLPALAEEQDPLSRAPGEPLWPEMYNGEALEQIRDGLSAYDWSSLYQQNPIPRDGALLQLDWFGRYDAIPRDGLITLSVDTAAVVKGDPWAILAALRTPDDYHYVLDVERARMEYAEGRRRVVAMVNRWNPSRILIENKQTGITLFQDLPELIQYRAECIQVNPKGDKTTRAEAETPLIRNGRVLLPHQAPWLKPFEDEVSRFPAVAHDDQVDALSQYLADARTRRRGGGGLVAGVVRQYHTTALPSGSIGLAAYLKPRW